MALDGYPIDENRLESLIADTHIPPRIVTFFLQWPQSSDTITFPNITLSAIWSVGAIPCLTWEPMVIENGKEKTISHIAISEGRYDPYLRDFARAAGAWGKPMIIRFAHEMNFKRYHWGTSEADYGLNSPKIYQNMFKYIVSIFRQEGANNILWAFCPNAESIPNPSSDPQAGWNHATAYYPGDEFVDILGMDGYNWGTTQTLKDSGWQSHWQSFESIFGSLYRELRAISSTKPVIVFETASTHQGGDKGQWIQDAFRSADAWNLNGMIWFEVNKELDWRLKTGMDSKYLTWLRTRLSPAQNWANALISERKYSRTKNEFSAVMQ
jgi:beta-mannanase